MSIEPVESPSPEEKKKAPRKATAKIRKHLVTTAYKSDIAERLDKLHAGGHTVLSITVSPDVRGWDIISYNEE